MTFNHSTVHPLVDPLMQLYPGIVYLVFSILLLLFDAYVGIDAVLFLPAVTVGVILLVLIKRKYHIPRERLRLPLIKKQFIFGLTFVLVGMGFSWIILQAYQQFEFARTDYFPIFAVYLIASGIMTIFHRTKTMPILFFISLTATLFFLFFPDYGTPQMVKMFFLVFGLLYFSTGAWEFRDKLSKIKQA